LAQDLFDKQKAYFATDLTKTYDWRIDQLDRLSRMLEENKERLSEASRRDFKTAFPENVFEVSATIASIEFTKYQLKEWMKPVEAPIPKFLAGFDSLTQAKSILVSPPNVTIDHLFPPYTTEKVRAFDQWFDY
jgi:acyl-CoA reductase-like NAD-dependent aldehyde dehydrogenase